MTLETEANRQKNWDRRFKRKLQFGCYLSEEDLFTRN
jgi:hypothetical protein